MVNIERVATLPTEQFLFFRTATTGVVTALNFDQNDSSFMYLL